MPKSGNPHRFTLGQALYNQRGEKFGWVTKIEKDSLGEDRACISDGGATSDVWFTTDQLKQGIVCNKSGLKKLGVGRAGTKPMGIGTRLFETPYIYIGSVVTFVGTPTDYMVMTDMHRQATHEKMRDGIIRVGRRSHIAI